MGGRPMTGLVLAGGRSSRMGSDKVLLEIGGEPLAGRVIRLLGEVCAEVLVASGDGLRLEALGAEQVADAAQGAGPLGGIVAGLQRARYRLVAVAAADMPFVSPPLMRLLADFWQGEPAVVPRTGGRLEPLHAVYDREAAPALLACLETGRRSVHRALAALGARIVDEPEWSGADLPGRFALSVNRPEDLQEIRRELG